MFAIFACGVSAAADGDPSWLSSHWSIKRMDLPEHTVRADHSGILRTWEPPGPVHGFRRAHYTGRGGDTPVMLAMHLRGYGSRDQDVSMSGVASPRSADGKSERENEKDTLSRNSGGVGVPGGGAGSFGAGQTAGQPGNPGSGVGAAAGGMAVSALAEKCLSVLQVCRLTGEERVHLYFLRNQTMFQHSVKLMP